MKKILTTLSIIAVALVPLHFAHAQTINCSPVTASTYNFCCGVAAGNSNAVDCKAYRNGYSTQDPSTVYTPGTLGSGSGSVSTGAVNTPGQADSVIVATPQAGSAELAQCSAIKFKSLLDILIWVKCIIVVAIIPIIFALALMFFLWGVMKFIAASDSAKKEEGKKFIIAGLIGLFVMTSLWGIVTIVSNTLGTGTVLPALKTSSLKK